MSAPALVDPAAPVIVEPQRAEVRALADPRRQPARLRADHPRGPGARDRGQADDPRLPRRRPPAVRGPPGQRRALPHRPQPVRRRAAARARRDRAARTPPAPGPARAGRGRGRQRDRRRLRRPRRQAREPGPRDHEGQDQRLAARRRLPQLAVHRRRRGRRHRRAAVRRPEVGSRAVAGGGLHRGLPAVRRRQRAPRHRDRGGRRLVRRHRRGPGLRRSRPSADRPRGGRVAGRLRAGGGPAGAGRGRRAGLDALVRDDHRRQPALRQGAGSRRAGRRPAVPHLPLLPPEERR